MGVAPVRRTRARWVRHRRAVHAARCDAGQDGPARAAGAQATRTAHRPGHPQVVHQATGLGELVGAVVREVALAQHLGAAVAHRQGGRVARFVVVVVECVVVGAGVEREDDLALLHGRRAQLELALPPGREAAVVELDVLGPADQSGPAGPVDRRPRRHADGTERLGEEDGGTHGDVEPRAAQDTGEADRQAVDVRHCAPLTVLQPVPTSCGRAARSRRRGCAPGLRGT